MPHPLDDARSKLDRADTHVKALDKATATWIHGDNPYKLVEKFDPNTGWHHWFIEVRDGPDNTLGLFVGDICNNLRSALDYTVWQLAGCPDDNSIAFPIVTFRKDWKGSLRKIAGVQEPWVTLIETMQPYHGHERGKALRALGNLNNRDKHKALRPAVISGEIEIDGAIDWGTPLEEDGWMQVLVHPAGEPVNDQPVLSMRPISKRTGRPMKRQFKFHGKITPGIGVDYGVDFHGDLRDLCRVMRDTVEQFAPAFR